jgi:hypothetical protein
MTVLVEIGGAAARPALLFPRTRGTEPNRKSRGAIKKKEEDEEGDHFDGNDNILPMIEAHSGAEKGGRCRCRWSPPEVKQSNVIVGIPRLINEATAKKQKWPMPKAISPPEVKRARPPPVSPIGMPASRLSIT